MYMLKIRFNFQQRNIVVFIYFTEWLAKSNLIKNNQKSVILSNQNMKKSTIYRFYTNENQ